MMDFRDGLGPHTGSMHHDATARVSPPAHQGTSVECLTCPDGCGQTFDGPTAETKRHNHVVLRHPGNPDYALRPRG